MESNTRTEKILFRRVRKITKSPRNGFKGRLTKSKNLETIKFHSKIKPHKNILKVIYVHLLKEQ